MSDVEGDDTAPAAAPVAPAAASGPMDINAAIQVWGPCTVLSLQFSLWWRCDL